MSGHYMKQPRSSNYESNFCILHEHLSWPLYFKHRDCFATTGFLNKFLAHLPNSATCVIMCRSRVTSTYGIRYGLTFTGAALPSYVLLEAPPSSMGRCEQAAVASTCSCGTIVGSSVGAMGCCMPHRQTHGLSSARAGRVRASRPANFLPESEGRAATG